MPTLNLTPRQFTYLHAAVARDLEALDDMAPWDIDDHEDEHAADVATCKEVGRLLKTVRLKTLEGTDGQARSMD